MRPEGVGAKRPTTASELVVESWVSIRCMVAFCRLRAPTPPKDYNQVLLSPSATPPNRRRPATKGTTMGTASEPYTEGFVLGTPGLVCRWRLAGGHVVAQGRHLRALAARRVNGERITPEMLAWVRQHLEWTLEPGASGNPEGVLMIIVDDKGQAAMSVGPYEPLSSLTLPDIFFRANSAREEASKTGVAPETMWFVSNDHLICDIAVGSAASGTTSLIEDLARTVGMTVERRSGASDAAQRGLLDFQEAFLVSDEHGVVPAEGHGGARSARFKESYEKLCASKRER